MTRRRPGRKPWSPPKGATYTVGVERCGAFARAENVPATDVPKMLSYLLTAMRELSKDFAELIPGPDVVPGGDAVDVIEDDYEQGKRRKRVGF